MNFKLNGFEELQKSLEVAVKRYPDKAEEKLEKTAGDFKERVVKMLLSTDDENAQEAIKGCELGKIEINNTKMKKDFSGTSSALYLIENGYEKVINKDNGKDDLSVTWVPGRFIVKQVSNEWNDTLPKVMQELVDDINKEVGLK